MSDTPRSVADLQALLLDNTSGLISPQDVRDFLVTALGVYGGFKFSGSATQNAPSGSGSMTPVTVWQANLPTKGLTSTYSTGLARTTLTGDYELRAFVEASAPTGKEIFFALGEQVGAGSPNIIARGSFIGAGSSARNMIPLNTLYTASFPTNMDFGLYFYTSDGSAQTVTFYDAAFSTRLVG